MKAGLQNILILLVAVTFQIGCGSGEEDEFSDSIFIVGETNESVALTTYEPVLELRESYELDVDKDSVMDFKLIVSNWMGMTMVYHHSSIQVLNNSFEISVVELPDTVRRCREYSEEKQLYVASVSYNTYSGYTCSGDRMTTIAQINRGAYPVVYSLGDTIKGKELWINKFQQHNTFHLAYESDNRLVTTDRMHQQFTITGTWLGDQSNKYLVFRKVSNGGDMYGWLRLSVSSFCDVRIHEYALQNEKY